VTERFKRWLTYKLVTIAAQLHWPMFIKLAEVAVMAHHKEAIAEVEEAIRDAMRLEQEHEYYYNQQQEQEYDADSDTGCNPHNTRKLH
jgi:hypothetical protein